MTQYYNLIRLGTSEYRDIHQACRDVAVNLARQIGEMGHDLAEMLLRDIRRHLDCLVRSRA